MNSEKQQHEYLLPTEAHTLKSVLINMCQKALTNMERLRDREEILQLINVLKSPAGSVGKNNFISTGIVREVDSMGRFVLPKELRKVYAIKKRDPMQITVEGDCIIIEPYKAQCQFCGSNLDIMNFKDKSICETCIGDLFNQTDLEDI